MYERGIPVSPGGAAPGRKTAEASGDASLSDATYLSNRSRRSTSPQNRHIGISISNSKQKVDDFVGGVDFLNLIDKYIVTDKLASLDSSAVFLPGAAPPGNTGIPRSYKAAPLLNMPRALNMHRALWWS